MAPMTRSRAIGNIPNALMAQYYRQRNSAGLIITEGTAPSVNALGYARIPGIYSAEQTEAWKAIAEEAHVGGARIFMQLMHVGRVAHPANMPADAEIVAPSAIACGSEMWTDSEGMQPMPTPRALQANEIDDVIGEFVNAAKNAIAAGFDGVELHGANGYLIEQFLNPSTNRRTDHYGGGWPNRNRFALEVTQAVADAIGGDRTAIRLSPVNRFNDMGENPDAFTQYTALCKEFGKLGLAYVHLVNYHGVGRAFNLSIREAFGGTLIVNGGLDRARAEAAMADGLGEVAAFASAYLANPDLPERLKSGIDLNSPDPDTFYSGDERGYTDYPTASAL
jgi:N-ethylmaleimide reductase